MTPETTEAPVPRASDPQRYRAARRVTWIGVGTNLGLAVVKGIAGIFAHSQALIADALHSLSDIVTDVLVLVAVRLGAREADSDHPYGHARFETAATVLLGVILIGAGLGIAVSAVMRLAEGALPIPTWPALAAAAFSIAANEWLFRLQRRIGRRYGAASVVANAWHHRSDALSSVAALVGVAGAMMGWLVLDTVAAVAVALMVVWAGGRLGWDALRELVDTALDPDEVEQIEAEIRNTEGVQSVHNLRTRRMGPEAWVDVHIEVPDTISVSEGHQIAERVRRRVIEHRPEVSEVQVHVDPEDDEAGALLLPDRETVLAEVRDCTDRMDSTVALEDSTVHYLGGEVHLELSVAMPADLSLGEAYARADELRDRIRRRTRVRDVQVHLHVPHSEGRAPAKGPDPS